MTTAVYYFGCIGQAGHYWWASFQVKAESVRRFIPWRVGVEAMAPGDPDPGGEVPQDQQVEGHAGLYHDSGWTALVFWDRSVDGRFGSVSGFFAQAHMSFDEMVVAAQVRFPEVWRRYPFEVTCVSVDAEPALNAVGSKQRAFDYPRLHAKVSLVGAQRDALSVSNEHLRQQTERLEHERRKAVDRLRELEPEPGKTSWVARCDYDKVVAELDEAKETLRMALGAEPLGGGDPSAYPYAKVDERSYDFPIAVCLSTYARMVEGQMKVYDRIALFPVGKALRLAAQLRSACAEVLSIEGGGRDSDGPSLVGKGSADEP